MKFDMRKKWVLGFDLVERERESSVVELIQWRESEEAEDGLSEMPSGSSSSP